MHASNNTTCKNRTNNKLLLNTALHAIPPLCAHTTQPTLIRQAHHTLELGSPLLSLRHLAPQPLCLASRRSALSLRSLVLRDFFSTAKETKPTETMNRKSRREQYTVIETGCFLVELILAPRTRTLPVHNVPKLVSVSATCNSLQSSFFF